MGVRYPHDIVAIPRPLPAMHMIRLTTIQAVAHCARVLDAAGRGQDSTGVENVPLHYEAIPSALGLMLRGTGADRGAGVPIGA